MNRQSVLLPVLAVLFPSIAHLSAEPVESAVRVAPAILAKDEQARLGIGELWSELSFIGEDGKPRSLTEFRDKTVVLAVRDLDCPVSRNYAPRLAALEKEFTHLAGSEVLVIHLFPGDAKSPAELRKELTEHGHTGVMARDPDGSLSRALRLRTTSEVFVFDRSRTLRYRGAIDDQYGIGYRKDSPRTHYLRDAVKAVIDRQLVTIPATTAPGCLSEHAEEVVKPIAANRDITYHNRISRIIQNHCQTCHRDGGAGPFLLETYAQVFAKRKMIGSVIEDRIMPPWGAKHEPGKWLNDPTLAAQDEVDLLSWIENGAPEGNPDDAPVPLEWPSGWQIGEPDLVIKLPEAIRIPAEGKVRYQYVKVKNPLKEDRWIKAMELRPTAPQVVHHALVFLGRELHGGGLQGYFTGLVPGETTSTFEDGFGKLLPAGETLIFQLHYTTNGKATTDQTELGFVFYDERPAREIHTQAAATTDFMIPAGAKRHKVVADYDVRIPGTILSFAPHTHLRGKAFRYDLIHPDGRVEELIDIPRYDFNWQMRYKLATPVYAPLGSKIRATAWYDNSADNPANPDPTRNVRHGEQTWDEMMIGYFEAYIGK
jgi:hypothetical protein